MIRGNPLDGDLLRQVAEIVVAYVSNNKIPAEAIPALISDTHRVLLSLSAGGAKPADEELRPAIAVRKSVTPNFIVCLDDGMHFKSLKRHLSTLGMTPETYRAKWGLPGDYPMVAPSYSATRSKLAKSFGLGRKRSAPRGPQGSDLAGSAS